MREKMKPPSFEEWLRDQRPAMHEFPVRYHMLMENERGHLNKIFNQARAAYEKLFLNSGHQIKELILYNREIPFDFSTMVNIVARSEPDLNLEGYASFMSGQARALYDRVQVWEQKSLWQYLKWWWVRWTR